REYKTYILIDISRASKEIIELLDDMHDLNFFFFRLQQLFGVALHQRESLIVFDEVQLCPKARQAIKHLVADGRYDYVETGSLISIRKHTKDILIPSEERRINMYPLDYEEFLWAIGNNVTFDLLKSNREWFGYLNDATNRGLMRDFRLYVIIGGMPQAVDTYLASNNLAEVDTVKRDILNLYIDDFEKIDSSGTLSMLFKSLPGELAKNKLKFEINGVLGKRLDDMLPLLNEMQESMTVNFCYRCSDPSIGLGLHRDTDDFKIYMGDTGLFVTMAFWDRDSSENEIYNRILADKLSVDLGYVFENVAAQMIRSSGHSLYYNTFSNREDNKKYYEVDFLLTKRNKLIPIEIKSSGYKTHKSLDEFCRKYSGRVEFPLMVYTKAPHKEGNLIMIPFYLLPLYL
ncbi:MAG: DUF4143 domain-containing protein, partial [Muribaculaceae bacterium]|nr:DUF4143 domain-containing protein [Muribaculaceae bacterium]